MGWDKINSHKQQNFNILKYALFWQVPFVYKWNSGRTETRARRVIESCLPAMTAQLVERWAPGSDSPGSRCSGARYMIFLVGMVRGWWQRPRPVEVGERAGHVWLCGHIKLSALNSGVIPELMTWGWESGPVLQALLPAGPCFPD